MSLFEDVQTIEINGKEVSKIEATIDGNVATIWEKQSIEMIEVTVVKVWSDSNNSRGLRPAQLRCTLSNGTMVYLNDANNWTYTLEVPKYDAETGLEINYTWSEQTVLGYTQTGMTRVDDTTTFTNTLPNRPPGPTGPTEPIT